MVSNKQPTKTNHMIADTKRQLTHEQQKIINYVVDKQNENFRTVAGKLVVDVNNPNQNRKKGDVPANIFRDKSHEMMSDIRDIRAIQRSLPESETAQDILVSSIISPNDMVSEELTWTLEGNFPGSLGQKLLSVVKTYFTDEFKLDRNLSTYLGNALFNRGSHILAVFPESAIDDIINSRSVVSLESFNKVIEETISKDNGAVKGKGSLGLGLLEASSKKAEEVKKPSYGLESFYYNGGVNRKQDSYYGDIIPGLLRITDNEDILKLSNLKRKMIEDDVNRKYRDKAIALESTILYHEPLTKEEEETLPASSFYRRPVQQAGERGNIAVVNDRHSTTRRSLGHPMCLDMPHESCIPVFTPGNAEDHIGYIFVLDQSGNPVSYLTEQTNLDEMENNFNQFKSSMSDGQAMSYQHTVVKQTLNDLSNLVAGSKSNIEEMNLHALREFYTRLIERDITARFNDGVYGKDIQIPRVEEIYNIMLARTLAGSCTQLLFMPASLVTYIAFYYDDYGVGESLISRSKNLAALRIAALYANSVAVVKNAVGTRQLKINLDPAIADGEERVAKIVNQYMEANAISPLFHSYDPRKISEALFRSSIELVVDGNDSMDQTTVETEYKSGDRPLIDNDYMESSKKDLINSWHVIPQLYDDSETPQFSSEFVTKNALYLKRNYVRALRFNSFLKEFVEKYSIHDGKLVDEMSKIIREGYGVLDKELIEKAQKENSTLPIIEEFLSCVYPQIPLPELESDSQIKNAWNDYKTKVESYLEVMLDNELLGHLIREEDDEKKKEVKGNIINLVKNFFLSDWIRKKNAFPEFDELFFVEGKPNPEIIKQLIDHQNSIADMVGDIVNLYYERANPSGGEEGGSSDDTSSASGEGDGFDTGSDDSGDDTSEDTGEETTEDESSDDTEEDSTEEESDDTNEEDSAEEDDSTEETSSDDSGSDGDSGGEDDTSELEELSEG